MHSSPSYGDVYCLVMRHSVRADTEGAQILMYRLSSKDTTEPMRTHTLHTKIKGHLALHCLDNVIFVHNRAAKNTLIFDVAVDTSERLGRRQHVTEVNDDRITLNIALSQLTPSPNSCSLNAMLLSTFFFARRQSVTFELVRHRRTLSVFTHLRTLFHFPNLNCDVLSPIYSTPAPRTHLTARNHTPLSTNTSPSSFKRLQMAMKSIFVRNVL